MRLGRSRGLRGHGQFSPTLGIHCRLAIRINGTAQLPSSGIRRLIRSSVGPEGPEACQPGHDNLHLNGRPGARCTGPARGLSRGRKSGEEDGGGNGERHRPPTRNRLHKASLRGQAPAAGGRPAASRPHPPSCTIFGVCGSRCPNPLRAACESEPSRGRIQPSRRPNCTLKTAELDHRSHPKSTTSGRKRLTTPVRIRVGRGIAALRLSLLGLSQSRTERR